jgi:hypothetical protein
MNHLNRQHGQVLMIIFASLFLGGGIATGVISSGKSIKSLQKTVRSMALEESRRDAVLAILDRWQGIAEPPQRSLKTHTRAFLDLIGNQGSTQAQFDELLLQHRAALLEAEKELLPLRDELRSTLDQQEWARLFR